MEFPFCRRNVLVDVECIGFRITWEFINIGLFGAEEVSQQITYEELFEYLDDLLEENSQQFDNIIKLYCERDDTYEVGKLIKYFAEKEIHNTSLEVRKWRVYLLKRILDKKNVDVLQGLLELLEFWVPMLDKDECPHIFPQINGEMTTQKYFTPTMYEFLIKKNREWMENEIKNIIEIEAKFY